MQRSFTPITLFLVFWTVIFCNPAKGQGIPSHGETITIEAVILDESHKSPVAYATIYNLNNHKGTVSNLDGFFRLEKVGKNDTLRISFLGYESFFLEVDGFQNNSVIYLKPKTQTLGEVVVLGDNTFLYNLLARCTKSNSTANKTAKTYFSLETFADNKQVELLECYYNGRYGDYNVKELSLKNGRVALSPFGNRFFLSTETSRAVNMHCLFDANTYFPASPLEMRKRKMEKNFDLNLKSRYRDESGGIIYEIGFKPIEDIAKSFEGTIWVDSMNQQIVKTHLKIQQSDIHPFIPVVGADSVLRIDMEITKTYHELEKEMYVKSIDFLYQIDYRTKEGKKQSVRSNALLYAYNYEETFDLPVFDYSHGNYHDYRQINAASYNEFFWENMDEFRLNDQTRNRNDLFLKKEATINSSEMFESNVYFDGGFLQRPYIAWSENRVAFRINPGEEAVVTEDLLPENRYNLEVQIYLDVNTFGDSMQVVSSTVFDPFNTFFKEEKTADSDAFLNLYFDLMELERRDLENTISAKAKNYNDVMEIFAEKRKEIEALKEDFLFDVQRGNSKKGMLKWNSYIKKELGIDNVTFFKLYE